VALYSKLQEFNEIGAKAQDYARENVSDAEFQGEHAKDIEKGFVLFSEANVKFFGCLGYQGYALYCADGGSGVWGEAYGG